MKLSHLLGVASLFPFVATAHDTSIDTLRVRQLDDVIVTGTRTSETTRQLPFAITSVSREALTTHQRSNVLTTLTESVPGLFVTQRGMMGYGVSGGAAGGINVRGLSAGTGQMLVLVDGHPQYQGIYGHSIADSYQTMMAERVEVLRGPASVLYGSNALGGVINIVTRRPQENGVHTDVRLAGGSYGTFEGEITNQVRKGRFTSTVAAQYGRSDNQLPRMGFEQHGCFARLGYDLSEQWNLFGMADVTHFNASNPYRTDIKDGELVIGDLFEGDQWITRGVASVGVENRYARTNGRISAYNNWGRHKINDGYGPTYHNNKPQDNFFRSKDALLGVTAYQSASLFKGNRVTLGFDYQNIYADAYYTNRETGEKQPANKTTVDKRMNELAAYVDVRQELASWCVLDAGVRYDHHSVSGGEWVPQAGIVFRPMPVAEIKATAGKGFRNPTAKEMYLYGMANDALRAERLWNYELAWHHAVADGCFDYGVNLFWIEGDNMIQTVAGKNINTGEICNRGVELVFNWNVNGHWRISSNHSYIDIEHPVVGAPAYKGYLGAHMHYGKWSADAGWQLVCGLYTAVGTKDEMKETFSLLNATVNYQVLPYLRLWVKGDNLISQKYEINAGYRMPGATVMGGVNFSF